MFVLLKKVEEGVQAAILGGLLILLVQACLVGEVDWERTGLLTGGFWILGFLFGRRIVELLGEVWSGVIALWELSPRRWW